MYLLLFFIEVSFSKEERGEGVDLVLVMTEASSLKVGFYSE